MRSAPPFIPSHDIMRGIVYAAGAAIRFAFMADVGLGNADLLANIDKLRALNVGNLVPLPQVSSPLPTSQSWNDMHDAC